jgi:hypothetical protein
MDCSCHVMFYVLGVKTCNFRVITHDSVMCHSKDSSQFEYGVSARALTPYSGGLNHCQNCTPASEDEMKANPKHVRQK